MQTLDDPAVKENLARQGADIMVTRRKIMAGSTEPEIAERIRVAGKPE